MMFITLHAALACLLPKLCLPCVKLLAAAFAVMLFLHAAVICCQRPAFLSSNAISCRPLLAVAICASLCLLPLLHTSSACSSCCSCRECHFICGAFHYHLHCFCAVYVLFVETFCMLVLLAAHSLLSEHTSICSCLAADADLHFKIE